jgi:hypothetical protein
VIGAEALVLAIANTKTIVSATTMAAVKIVMMWWFLGVRLVVAVIRCSPGSQGRRVPAYEKGVKG